MLPLRPLYDTAVRAPFIASVSVSAAEFREARYRELEGLGASSISALARRHPCRLLQKHWSSFKCTDTPLPLTKFEITPAALSRSETALRRRWWNNRAQNISQAPKRRSLCVAMLTVHRLAGFFPDKYTRRR